MNRLIERRGPCVGLITTEGHEDAILIGRGAQWTDGTRLAERRNLAVHRKSLPIVPRQMIVGVKERIDSTGTVVRPLDEDDVRRKLRRLMERGARAIVVATLWSFANPVHELRIQGGHPRRIQGLPAMVTIGADSEDRPGCYHARSSRPMSCNRAVEVAGGED